MLPSSTLVPLLIMLTVFTIVGVSGNLLVTLVYWRAKNMERLTSTTFILTLAVLDLITCLLVIPMTMYFEYADFSVGDNFLCKLYVFSTPFVVSFSAFVMVAIAIDRYLCICHPFRHAMNPFRAKLMIVFAALVATASSIIWPIAYGVWSKTDVITNITNTLPNKTMLSGTTATHNWTTEGHVNRTVMISKVVYTGKCDPDFMIISDALRQGYRKFHFILYFVVLVVITVMYILIYTYVVKRRRRRAIQRASTSRTAVTCCEETTKCNIQENGNHDNEVNKNEEECNKIIPRNESGGIQESLRERLIVANIKTAMTLFVVTLVFAVTYFPTALMGDKIIPYNTIAFYMYFLNNVANPIIYGFMNQNFRSDLKNLLCKPRRAYAF